MSITVTTDVFCDGCPEWTGGTTSSRKETRKAEKEAARKGWLVTGGRHLCPRCRAARKANSPKQAPE